MTVKEMMAYCWDEKAFQQSGKKKRPMKVNDHTCDALRYFLYRQRYEQGGLGRA